MIKLVSFLRVVRPLTKCGDGTAEEISPCGRHIRPVWSDFHRSCNMFARPVSLVPLWLPSATGPRIAERGEKLLKVFAAPASLDLLDESDTLKIPALRRIGMRQLGRFGSSKRHVREQPKNNSSAVPVSRRRHRSHAVCIAKLPGYF